MNYLFEFFKQYKQGDKLDLSGKLTHAVLEKKLCEDDYSRLTYIEHHMSGLYSWQAICISDVMRQLASYLTAHPEITHLRLTGNALKDNHLGILMFNLGKNSCEHLSHFDVSHNNLTAHGLKALTQNLIPLLHLNIAGNPIGACDLQQLVTENNTLTSLVIDVRTLADSTRINGYLENVQEALKSCKALLNNQQLISLVIMNETLIKSSAIHERLETIRQSHKERRVKRAIQETQLVKQLNPYLKSVDLCLLTKGYARKPMATSTLEELVTLGLLVRSSKKNNGSISFLGTGYYIQSNIAPFLKQQNQATLEAMTRLVKAYINWPVIPLEGFYQLGLTLTQQLELATQKSKNKTSVSCFFKEQSTSFQEEAKKLSEMQKVREVRKTMLNTAKQDKASLAK